MFDRERLQGSKILTKDLQEVIPDTFAIARRQIIHGACTLVGDKFADAAVSSSYSLFAGTERCETPFFSWLAKHPLMYAYYVAASHGIVAEKMNFDQERWLSFPLRIPPLNEQRRISEILDSVDESIRSTEHLVRKLSETRHASLSNLIRKAHWPVRAIGQICKISSGGTPDRSVTAFWRNGNIPWVKTGEVCNSAIQGTEEQVSQSAVHAARLRIYPPGTVLVAMYGQGATRGRVGILGLPATVNQACAALQCDATIIQEEFLFHFLMQSYDELRRLGHGSHQTNLNAKVLAQFEIAVPPLSEQDGILRHIAGWDSRITLESTVLRKLRTVRRGLMEDLLTGRVRVKVGEDQEA